MNKIKQEVYNSKFKANIALQALNNASSIGELSRKHDVDCSKIKAWVDQLKERAELLFIDSGTQAKKNDKIQNHAVLPSKTVISSPSNLSFKKLDHNIITYNRKCLDMWNVSEDVLASGSSKEILQQSLNRAKNADSLDNNMSKARANPQECINNIIELKDGRFFEHHAVPYRVDGKILGQINTFINITKYKKAEQKLTKFVNLLHSINANVNDGILRSTPEKGLIYVNDAFVKIFGYNSKKEALAISPSEFYATKDQRQKSIQELKEKGGFTNKEFLFKRKDGSTFWGLENSSLIKHNGQTFIDSVVTDINEWKKSEQALRKSEEKHRTILKNIEEGYFEMNLAGDLTFFNAKLVEMMRYSAEDLIGFNNREYMDEANAKKVYQTFNEVYRSGTSVKRFDSELICGDKSKIYVEASVTLRKDSDGNAIGFSGMIRDITERKRKEQQIKKSLKEKEVLLGEIHHRVKNNLAIISGLLYLQANETGDQKAAKALMESQSRINSMALIHELLYDSHAFANLNPRQYINKLIEHIASNLDTGQANIETNIEAESFELEMNMAIPCALIINELLTNAFKYAFEENDCGKIDIIFRKNKHENYHLEVADNGQGLPENFDVTDRSHHSLGLSLVKTLSQQLDGKMQVQSDTNGSRFIITFTG